MVETRQIAGATLWTGLAWGAGVVGGITLLEHLAFAPPHQWLEARPWAITLVLGLALGGLVGAIAALAGLASRSAGPRVAREVVLVCAVALAAAAQVWPVVGGHVSKLLPGAGPDARLIVFTAVAVTAWCFLRHLAGRAGLQARDLVSGLMAGIVVVVAARTALRGGAGLPRSPAFAPAMLASAILAGLMLVLLTLRGGRLRSAGAVGIAALAILLGQVATQHPNRPVAAAKATGARSDAPMVLIIVLDTFRSDALDLSPSTESRTPHLYEFSRKADTYTEAIANASWTLPGHASLFTGRILRSHRTDLTNEPGFQPVLPPHIPTLAGLLTSAGYRSSCISANSIVGFASDLARGCQYYFNPSRSWMLSITPLAILGQAAQVPLPISQLLYRFSGVNVNATAAEIVDEAIAGMDGYGRGSYLFLNFLDVHGPLQPAPGEKPVTASASRALRNDLARNLIRQLDIDELWSRNAGTLHAYYLSQAGVIDRELGRLFGALQSRGLYDDALVIVTADHGETFKENQELRGYFGHHSAWEPAVRIPLLVKKPGQAEGRVHAMPVQQVDVAPTVLETVGLPTPPEMEGRPLGEAPRTPIITEWYERSGGGAFPYFPGNRVAVYHGRYKLVQDSLGGEQLFDLEESPWEEVDAAADHPALVASLRSQLDFTTSDGELPAVAAGSDPDPGLIERLRALGYVK